MAVNRLPQIERLLKIILLLQGGGDRWTAERLAQECGVNKRTIYRSMKILAEAGVPYFYDEEHQCYSIRQDFFMPPVQLTLEESLALVALTEQVARTEQISYTRPASRAGEKIRSLLPPSIRQNLENLTRHIHIRLAASNPPEGPQDVYHKLQQALQQRVAVRCTYESSNSHPNKNSAQTPFLFQPYVLHYDQRAWYTIGYHTARKEVRCLKLTRFTQLELTNHPYEIPKSFSLEKHLGNAWRMIRGKPTYDIELIFDPCFADTISDTHWHATQELEWLDDGSVRFRCRVDGLQEIVWWVLSMGPYCKVIKPPELANEIRSLAEKVLQRYSDTTD